MARNFEKPKGIGYPSSHLAVLDCTYLVGWVPKGRSKFLVTGSRMGKARDVKIYMQGIMHMPRISRELWRNEFREESD